MSKTICFHAGCSVLIGNPDKTMKKLEEVLKTFEEKKDSIHVIWCSDDNTEEILKSSVGSDELYNCYYSLVKAFIESGAGEYIINPDADQLAEKCDAYYGDCGYVMGQFLQAGKPVMQMDL